MISIQSAITRFRRDIVVGTVLRNILIASAAGGFTILSLMGMSTAGISLMITILLVWMVLTYMSAQGSRLAADSPSLIAAGRFDEAEQRIDKVLRAFSLFRTTKLLGLHHLAILRHSQKRWEDAAALCRELLGQRLGNLSSLSRPTSLILADALLEMGDANGTYQALMSLYQHRLTLNEAINLCRIQTAYCAKVSAWGQMMQGVASKVQLAELMPASASAQTQALLALAAKKTGQNDWSEWLRQRAELLSDPQTLTQRRPMLWGLWEKGDGEAAAPVELQTTT